MGIGDIVVSIVKIVAILGYIYGLLWVLGHPNRLVKIGGTVLAFALVQVC